MKLIDANKLKRKVQRVATEAWMMKLTSSVETVLNQFLDYIEEAPSIESVHCGECAYKGEISCPMYYRDRELKPTDFCSYGEREGE